MLKIYKIVISLLALVHFGSFLQAVIMPAEFLKSFGAVPTEEIHRLTVHFGLLLMIFAFMQTVAAYWTFKGKVEGIQLGLVIGIVMILATLLDLVIIGQGIDYPLLAFGALTTIAAYMALKNYSPTT